MRIHEMDDVQYALFLFALFLNTRVAERQVWVIPESDAVIKTEVHVITCFTMYTGLW